MAPKIAKHFHLGKPEDCPSDKILIRELWSSPMVFRRASKNWTLSDDAKDFRAEAKRRVQYFRDNRVSNDISQNALNALSQAESGGIIVASCKPIQDNDSDPPCIGAKHYYWYFNKNQPQTKPNLAL